MKHSRSFPAGAIAVFAAMTAAFVACSTDREIGELFGGDAGIGGASSSTATSSATTTASSASSSSASTSSSSGGTGGVQCESANLPSNATPIVIASGAAGPPVALSDGKAYWVDQGEGGADSRLYLVPLPCVQAGILVWNLGPRPVGGVVPATLGAYVTVGPPGELLRVLDDGSGPVSMASGASAYGGVTVDGTDVYWTVPDDGLVLRMPIDADAGTAPTVVANGQGHPSSIALGGSQVFWIDHDSGDVRWRAKNLAGSYAIVAAAEARPGGLVAGTTGIAWIDQSQSLGANDGAMRFAGWGKSPVLLAQSLSWPQLVTTTVSYAYWTDANDGTVSRAPLTAGPNAPEVVASGQDAPVGIASHGSMLCWVDIGTKRLVCSVP